MKSILIVTVAIAVTTTAFAQSEKNNLVVAADFKSISRLSRMQTSDAFQSYKSGNTSGSQFYNTTWSEGTVRTYTNEEIVNYLLLYDKVRQELFIRPKDTDMVIMADKSQVKSFTLNMDKPHVFVQGAKYGNLVSNSFFEILVPDSDFTLLKLTKTNFEKADYTDMLKVKNGEVNDAFVDNVSYYVYHKGMLDKIALTERSIQKVLGDKSAKVQAFLNMHENEVFNEQLLIALVITLNH